MEKAAAHKIRDMGETASDSNLPAIRGGSERQGRCEMPRFARDAGQGLAVKLEEVGGNGMSVHQ